MDRKKPYILILIFALVCFAGQKTDSVWVTGGARVDGAVTIGTGSVASYGYYIDTGHTSATGGVTNSLSFPSGLYDSTAIPVSILYKSSTAGQWETGTGASGNTTYLTTSATTYSLYYPDIAGYHSARYKVIFQKIKEQHKP
jgi:hypothetical protein